MVANTYRIYPFYIGMRKPIDVLSQKCMCVLCLYDIQLYPSSLFLKAVETDCSVALNEEYRSPFVQKIRLFVTESLSGRKDMSLNYKGLRGFAIS